MTKLLFGMTVLVGLIIMSLLLSNCGNVPHVDNELLKMSPPVRHRPFPTEFTVAEFNPFANFETSEDDTLYLEVGIQEDIFNGIFIPEQDYFTLTFKLKNNGSDKKRFYYKLLYQNESYKFSEAIMTSEGIEYNRESAGNFYGSWEGIHDTIHLTPLIPADGMFHKVTDSFRIVGNPRNENIYSGRNPDDMYLTKEKIESVKSTIRNSPDWLEMVVQKASDNKVSLEQQIHNDALWVLNRKFDEGDHVSRWKRNPRAGSYRFALVIIPEDKIHEMPANLQNLSIKENDSLFINPFYTLFYDTSELSDNLGITEAAYGLKTVIRFDLSSGIYVDPLKYTKLNTDSTYFDSGCNSSDYMFRKAQIEQFFHNIDRNWVLNNIPVVMDYENFSGQNYKDFETRYSQDSLIHDYIRITECPCENVRYSPEDHAIYLINPASAPENMKKENVGVQSRVGFTYGKITAKIRFPEMLNKHDVWNGITNAFWLIYQNESEWNLRKPCANTGYIPKQEIGETTLRTWRNFYSEIDIEIVKASKHWPEYSYHNNVKFPKTDPDKPSDIIVTSTNWDLACLDPENFSTGVAEIEFDGKKFYPHRWDQWYKALTTKYAVNHDEIFNRDYYYYQIDWQPERIIWRIGPEKERMFVIGYLDTSVSSIPDNQMTFVVTQEYHHSAWWPTTEFKQEFIPYPARPIVGKVLEVVIE